MLVTFSGQNVPAEYLNNEFYVEGVGSSIVLVDQVSLITSANVNTPYTSYSTNSIELFDRVNFDKSGFDSSLKLPLTPEYVTINRASKDLNPWSRYNRWVHKDVIAASAEVNGFIADYPADQRAKRAIIEFDANIQLFNFGNVGVAPVDFIDTVTTDAFNTAEGSTSTFYIGGMLIDQGHRIIFNADLNPEVRGKIYEATPVYINGVRTLTLVEVDSPAIGSSVSIVNGSDYAGSSWWYSGDTWIFSQQKTQLNQSPLFDLYDDNGHSYGDINYYTSDFAGNKILGYKIGTGITDPYLKFPLAYRNTNAIGSFILTNFLASDTINFSQSNQTNSGISTNLAYCKISTPTGDVYKNSWVKSVDYQIPIITTSATSYYEEPLSLTNNPLNSIIPEFTISELGQHLQSIIKRLPDYKVSQTNAGNLRDLSNYTNYGTELITSLNPIAFSQMFLGKKEHNIIDAFARASDQYNQFKFKFLNTIAKCSNQTDPVSAVDQVLTAINKDKSFSTSYYLSDMLGYGTDKIVKSWTVTNSRNTIYPLISEFSLDKLILKSVLIYLNGTQLVHGDDYKFDVLSSTAEILKSLKVNDVLEIVDYLDTSGSFVPPTPSKLGLYPKFVPSMYLDDTYVTPVKVIQGHDGSIMIAYNDFRDDIILELEKRIYNNIKVQYNSELLNVDAGFSGAFRNTKFSSTEINKIIQQDFVRWAGQYGIDYTSHTNYDSENSKTWNYTDTNNLLTGKSLSGSWRSIFKFFYDTDRPHTHPWEMLMFKEKPEWWDSQYGPAPYAQNNLMWKDLEAGYISQGVSKGVNLLCVRPGLSKILPINILGKLRDPVSIGLVSNYTAYNSRLSWLAGDQGPAETAWRRSSYWPFVVQRLLALTSPSTYATLMYDTSRVQKNLAGQWTYGSNKEFFKLPNLVIHGENNSLTSGYSVILSEIGQQRTSNYIAKLRQDLSYISYNLFHKVGGFVNKNTLQIIIDAYEPTSTSPGAILPQENYKLRLNVSNPVKSVGISGFIIQKTSNGFVVKGYDKTNPYFTYYSPIRNSNTPANTIGGISEQYVTWAPDPATIGATGLTSADLTTANSSVTGKFYQAGQIVYYGNNFYRVKTSHRAESTFTPSYYQIMPSLPTVGGATVQLANRFDTTEMKVSYGTIFSNIQEVYDVIMGYGKWLENQGFVFDEFNKDLNTVIDWNLTAKEFLFWTTQNWAENSIITLSPFADQIKYQFIESVVDNIFDSFYEYSLLKADGTPYPQQSLSISRNDGLCTISTLAGSEGIYFARLNSVQKEHAMVFDNKTIFGDIIYQPETGNRQKRIKLVGFRTANWNGDYFSPGFVYDSARVSDWEKFTDYNVGDVVRFNGNYYSAVRHINGAGSFDIEQIAKNWNILGSKPVAGLLPNFDYKINQFEDFYSLDIDNFDAGQQKMAQHLTGYTPRTYLNNIFTNPISQYKFYQGFIREKGTKNSITKLAKASIQNLQGEISYNEEWAFRVGQYGSYSSYQEIEVPLIEGTFLENPQIINFVDSAPKLANDLIHYSLPSDLQITPDNYVASETFVSSFDEEKFLLTHSGYVRIDDVTATAYNENSLLDIANSNQLTDGDTIWLGFKQDGGWDVYRYIYAPVDIIGVYVSAPVSEITFTTRLPHGLSVGDIISVSRFNDQVNGVYIVKSIPKSTRFSVASSLSSITNSSLEAPGQLYRFASARLTEFDLLPSDKELYKLPSGTKFWIDPSTTTGEGWSVYEKNNNYSSATFYTTPNIAGQGLGKSISKRKGSDIIVVGAPTYKLVDGIGEIFVYEQNGNELTNTVRYKFGEYAGASELGHCVVYDDISFNSGSYGLIFAGAPGVNSSAGSVKISTIDAAVLDEGTNIYLNNVDPNSRRFGSSIFVQRNTGTKLVLIGAPDTAISFNTGSVYSCVISNNNGSIAATNLTTLIDNSVSLTTSSQWGYSISGSDDASFIAIGAPGYNTGTGLVTVFNKSLIRLATLNSPFGQSSRFGETILMSQTGNYLFVAAPSVVNDDESYGKVVVYKNTNGIFSIDQILENPIATQGMNFGKAMDINTATDTLIISATGINHTFKTKFDNNLEIFDNGVTEFSGTELNSGAVYIYNRKNSRFVLANEFVDDRVAAIQGTDYGSSIVIDDTEVIIGSPAYNNTLTYCGIYQFNILDATATDWNKIRQQQNLVDVNTIQKVSLIDTFSEEVIEYLDVIDPLKGKIAGIAEQEITYKLISDPAIYSIGVAGTVNDTNSNWLDSHVGELWWDLSTAKYVWYEQSDLEYRRNNWGRLFPGATIDVYEWVGSSLLPSEWSTQADTPTGLAKGISGQPKFSDNSVVSVKQVYDAISNSFSNVYFYWVKNKIIVPDAKNRRISSYQVASTIADPVACGLQFVSIIDKDAVSLANIASTLIDNRISLNISQDISSDIQLSVKHTEWLLLQENSSTSMPNALLEKKLIDSLVGHDTLGNVVPNPALTDRTKYGIGIRPQQSFFKDRLAALRNIVEFVNNVLINEQITGRYDFTTLKSQEELPTIYSGEYDLLVEDNQALSLINTGALTTASIRCYVNTNGQITGTNIISAGFGYGTLNPILSNTGTVIGYTGPTLTFENTSGSDGVISTMVNDNGQIISTSITNYGTGYTGNFIARARPHTVIVSSDSTFNGKWTIYKYNINTHNWYRSHTQKYNTALYWEYVDWSSKDYNKYQEYSYTIGSTHELDKLNLIEGQYVKILNQGDGRYAIVKKLANNIVGTFGLNFDLVYSERGTIQILDSIWDLYNNKFGFDYISTYDQTQWDQTADLELQYLIEALKTNIFINELKVNWNLLFFKAVRYALTEQKLLDWAFKTSFINVTNNAGSLDQRPVYKLQDSKYYEQYINEIKPFHTKIRNFTTLYSVLEPTNTLTTDFDLPDYYNNDTGRFESVDSDNPLIDTHPWKSWNDNHLPANNNPVRKVNTTLKFDRISKVRQIGDVAAYDKFIGTGKDSKFTLNWKAYPDKNKIKIVIDGILQLSSDYVVHYFDTPYQLYYNDYKKQYTTIEFLNSFPNLGSLIEIYYEKSSELFNAAERILNSYVTTGTLPGVELSQLMSGTEYPGLTIGGQYEGNTFTSLVDPDSLINGGSISSGQLISAKGINPEDVTLDGEYGFVTPNTSYAPEEFVPGHVLDSLGINVYTKAQRGTAIVLNRNVRVEASTATTSTFSLPELPTTIDNILVTLNGKILSYVDDSIFSTATQAQFSIDWSAVKLVIPPQDVGGVVGYSIIGVSGGSGFTAGVVDKASVSVVDIPTAQVRSLASADTIKSAFVTVNGRAISQVTTSSNYGYMFAGSSVENRRESIQVYNLPLGKHTIQAWFFAEAQQYFNTIHEQIFVVTDSTSTSVPFTLDFPPGVLEPASSQSIVEITDVNGTRRLLPPNVNYYSVTDTSVVNYPVNVVGIYQVNTDSLDISNSNVNVYRQGVALVPGFDYSVDNVNKVVTINTGNLTLKVGDAIAIETFNPTMIGTSIPVNNGTNYIYNYRIVGSSLYLAPGAQSRNGTFNSIYYDHGVPAISSATIKVITYTDSDDMLLHTERFTGNYNRRFTISRPTINDDYIWVTMFVKDENSFLTTISLINKIDYILLDDNATVQLSDKWAPDINTLIEITSFSSHNLSSTVLGYRIFHDMLGKTSFTRLSSKYSTYLTQPLKFTDTQIFVNDATVLTDPLPSKNMPGVVLISGERIEFFQRDGSILSQLRRATLGTAPSYYLEAGTKVIDQGLEQIIPYEETTRVQNTFSNTFTNIYSIGKVNNISRDSAANVDRYDGIVLSTASAAVIYDPFVVSTVSTAIDPTDQLNVYYGGRKLRKTGYYYHETTATFDSIMISSIKGSTSTLSLLPVAPAVGDAYMVTDINQVWVYTGLRFESTASGYVYSGLKFAPPEFSVIAGASQQLILNTSTITITNGVKISIVKKEFAVANTWNDIDPTTSTKTLSLLDSNNGIAKFLQDAPAELPDSHYYGTDLELTDEFGNPLVDDQSRNLQVYY
jgi:hypothetical protein